MNKKEFLKSINNLDDRFLREGEEFFAPVEAEKNPSVYKKKGISLKPVISAAACCAAVAAVVVFMGGLNNNMSVTPGSANSGNTEAVVETEGTENTDATNGAENTDEGVDITLDPQYENNILTEAQEPNEAPNSGSENNDLFIVSVKSSLVGAEVEGDGTLNITQPQEIKVSLDLTTEIGSGEAKPARFFVFKDGTPASFSTDEAANVTYYDTMLLPDSKIHVPVSFTADKNDRHISIFCMIDPTIAEITGTGVFCADFINAACTEILRHGENLLDIYNDNASEFEGVRLGELDEEGFHAYVNFTEGKGSQYIVFFVNGQPVPAFGGEYRGYMNYNAHSAEFDAYIPNEFVKPGDVVYAVVIDGIERNWYASFRMTVE